LYHLSFQLIEGARRENWSTAKGPRQVLYKLRGEA